MEPIWQNSYEPRVPTNFAIPHQTLGDILTESARKYPYNTASSFVLSYILGERYTVGGTLTYRQLNDLTNRFAAALAGLGVQKGDRIALMLPNSPHYVIAFFGAMKIGAVVVNINPTYTPPELQHQLHDSGAETIVLLNLFYPKLREIQAQTAVKRAIVAHVFDTLSFPSSLLVKRKQQQEPGWVNVQAGGDVQLFGELLARSAAKPPTVSISPDDVALFQYTGGTTGLPKAAMLTHRNLVANTLQILSWWPSAKPGEEKMMAAIPFFHVYGMTVCMIFGLYIGAEMIIVPNPRPIENVMKIMQHERATMYPGVPAMYIGIINHPKIGEYDLKSVRACISGSAPLPIEVQEKFGQITGGRLVEGYGMTEASPVTHCNPLFGTRKSGSIGIPLPLTEAKIISLDTGEDLAAGTGQEGELLVRGPQVMQGYWNQPDETAKTFTADGWLRTGDIAKIDDDGFFFIVDRKKDMIIASGFKVLPRDVEEVLFTHPKVLEAAVVGINNPARGDDTVKAYVVLKDGMSATADEIKNFCKDKLAPYKIPRDVEFRTELPKTLVGKVLRRVLVEEEKAKRERRTEATAV